MARRPTVALAGAGVAAAVQAMAARAAGAEVVAVASRTRASAERLAAEVGARPCRYEDLPAGADVVVVATPPPLHAPQALAALAAGAAVVVEKPLATTLAEADDVVAAGGDRVLYGENLLAAPIVDALLARLPDLGPLTNLEARSLQDRPGWGGFLSTEWGGGTLFDLGVHPLGVVLAAAAPARPVAVAATLTGAADHGTDEHAEVVVHFDDGLAATVVSSWRATAPVWDVQAASATGVLRADLLPAHGLERDGDPVALPAGDPAPVARYGYAGQLRRFFADLAAGRAPASDATFGRDVLDVVCGAYASAARRGDAVPLPFDGPRDRTPLSLWRPGVGGATGSAGC